MRANAVSTMKDNETLCRPSAGYSDEIEIDLNDFVQVKTFQGALPESDEQWPHGSPRTDVVIVGDKILERKKKVQGAT